MYFIPLVPNFKVSACMSTSTVLGAISLFGSCNKITLLYGE